MDLTSFLNDNDPKESFECHYTKADTKKLIFLGRLQSPQPLRHKGGCLEQSSEAAGRKLVSTDNDMPINPVK